MFEGPHVMHCCTSGWVSCPSAGRSPTANRVAVAAVIIVIGTWEPNLQIADAGSAPTRPSLIGPRLTENNGSNF